MNRLYIEFTHPQTQKVPGTEKPHQGPASQHQKL